MASSPGGAAKISQPCPAFTDGNSSTSEKHSHCVRLLAVKNCMHTTDHLFLPCSNSLERYHDSEARSERGRVHPSRGHGLIICLQPWLGFARQSWPSKECI